MLARKVMYASSENAARIEFQNLKTVMGEDGQRAVSCMAKDLESLLTHYSFDKRLWRTLKTTNPIERVNKELKRRTKTMETVGEKTLMIITAFTALRLEYNWNRHAVNSPHLNNLSYIKRIEDFKKGADSTNAVESTFDVLMH